MTYKARFSTTFLKKEKKQPKQIKDRIAQAVRQILTDPYRGVPLIGDYRIIYEINEKEKLVTFHIVTLRKKAYR